MKRITILLLVSSVLLSSKPVHFRHADSQLTKDYVYVPAPALGDFYISSIEVTNQQYRDFLNDLKAKGKTDLLKIAMVDSIRWLTVVKNSTAFADYYFQHSAYSSYPVVNVSKEAAQLYCDWLTERIKAQSSEAKIHFALPTEAQWCSAAKAGNANAIYPWEGESIACEKKGKLYKTNLCNYNINGLANASSDESKEVDITAPSKSYLPNKFNIYNMSGNVAEMVADQNYVVGGSWHSTAEKMKIGSHESISVPNPTVGFRPVMIVEK